MSDVAGFLDRCAAHVEAAEPVLASGRLTRISGLVMEAVGLKLAVGSTCAITQRDLRVEAEVVGFNGERLYLMPTGDPQGLKPGAHVEAVESYVVPRFDADDAPAHAPRVSEPRVRRLPAGTALLGRVLDGSGVPLDGLGALHAQAQVPLHAPPINPILRAPIEQSLSVGVRAIDALLTIGRGQRMGLFAGSGVGKSVLLGMMARYTAADVIVVGLIGERGREVKDFIENILGADGLRRSVVVAAPADVPPLLRVRGAAYATALAEHFRDRGANVLLIMDSLTRYAMASREIALAIGEPPATKGYPPSVFAKLPALVERAGNGVQGGGSITAFYTVLTEGDDPHDPVADHARAILDGHIVLSRDLAEQGHYPAIDIEASISRVMPAVASRESIARARSFKRYASRLRRSRDLINVGAYQAGADPVLDRAIVLQPQLDAFVQQDMHEKADPHVSAATLATLIPETGETA